MRIQTLSVLLFVLAFSHNASASFDFRPFSPVNSQLDGNNSASVVDLETGITATFTATGGTLQTNDFGSTITSGMLSFVVTGLGIGGNASAGVVSIDAGESLSVVFDHNVDLTSLLVSSIPSSTGTLTINAGGATSTVALPGLADSVATAFPSFTPAQSLAAGSPLTLTATSSFTLNQLNFTAGTAAAANVPEPSSFALGLMAVLGTVLARRRKKTCRQSL